MKGERGPRSWVPSRLLEPLKRVKQKRLLMFFTRKERIVSAGVLVGIALVFGLLLFPLATQEATDPTPPAPKAINDTNGDGLSDVLNVFVYGSNPTMHDTSGDGIPDKWKADHAEWDDVFRTWRPHPALNDSHLDLTGDGLTLLDEYNHGTDPHNKDTSGDGFTDGWLVRSGLNPTEPQDPEHVCAPDGMTIQEKHEHYEEPGVELLACAEDSSGNGLPDQAAIQGEWTISGTTHTFEPTEPTAYSTGGSGVPDGWLIYHGLNPHSAEHRYEDITGNGLSTREAWEWIEENNLTTVEDWDEGLDPSAFSSAGHGIPDGWLLRYGLDPLDVALADQHLTESGLTIRQEYEHGTDPSKADTSGDGLTDGECVEGWAITVDDEERWVHCNPLVADSSGDGLPDKAQREGSFEHEGRVIEFPPTNPMSTDTSGDGISDLDTITAMPPGMPQLDPTKSDTSGSGLLDGEEWTLFKEAAKRARTDTLYTDLVASEQGIDPSEVPEVLEPWGDLSGDGTPNVLAADATEDGLNDGEQVHPPTRGGRQLPTSDPTLVDSDGDELPDQWELRYTRYDEDLGGWLLDAMLVDSTGSGVSDAKEDYASGCFSDPGLEGNGIPWEDKPFPNELEMEHNTDPFECDTIGDGLPDGWTVFMNERLQEAGVDLSLSPTIADSMEDGVMDGERVSPVTDLGDGRVNMVDEDSKCPEPNGKTVCVWRWGTAAEPLTNQFADLGDKVDVHGDCQARERCTVVLQLTLAHEVDLQTDPSTWDTSGDGFQDGWKVLNRFDPTDPNVPSPNEDLDGDGFPNWNEYLFGSDPLDQDTDKGGVPDGPDEDALNPAMDDGDCDWDGILDREEASSETTEAGAPDTSGDGLLDAHFNPEGCERANGGFLTPEIGVDIVAIPDEDDDGSSTLLGNDDFGTDPSTWDTSGDRLPDGWKALHDLNPLSQHSPQLDLSGDGISLIDAYNLGRPAWWDEGEHGAWWFGTDPTIETSRDIDGDGLDDTLFDPEPLSPSNDCSLPDHWDLPPAWEERGQAFCLATEPPEDDLDAVLTGLRQLAYTHVMNTMQTPEEARQAQDAAQRETIRATSIHVDETLHTDHVFNATVELCKVNGDGCSTPSTLDPPPVGVYVSYGSIGDIPDPREDILVCIIDQATGWTVEGTCRLDPGSRDAPAQGSGLLLAPHAHGFVNPDESWTLHPGDITPGRQAQLVAWPLPTERDAVLAPEVDPDENPPPTMQEPVDSQASIHIPDDLVFERGESREITFRVTDTVGHPLPDHRVEVTWKGEDEGTERTTEDGQLTLELDPGSPDAPTNASLTLEAVALSGIEGATRVLDVPVRMPTSLEIPDGIKPKANGLQVHVGLLDHLEAPVPDQTLEASLAVQSTTASKGTAVTGPDGNATLNVGTPPDVQPGQAPLIVTFPGNDAWSPAEWQGRADVVVEPNVTLKAPPKISATEGATVEAGLFLPSGDPLVPPPGDPVEMAVTLAGERVEQTVANPLPGGTVDIPIPGGAGMMLGHQTARIEATSETFIAHASKEVPLQVTSPAAVTIQPERIGAGVENPLDVRVTDVWDRGLEGAPVEILLGDAHATSVTGPDGTATTQLGVPLDVERGERSLSVSVGPTNASDPLDLDLPVTVVMGTMLNVPSQAPGSLETVQLGGELETARGEPMPHQPLIVEAFDRADEVQLDSDGRFEVSLFPTDGIEPGTYEATIRFEGTDELAATIATVDLVLTSPTAFETLNPDPGAIDAPFGLEGRVVTQNAEPVSGGTVTARLDGRTVNATVNQDGTFQAELDTEGMAPGEYTAHLSYDPATGYAPAETTVPIELREEVQLTVQKRTDEEGVHVSVQAVRQDGAPLSNAELAVMTPEPFIVTTDEDGVARVPFKHGVLEPGSEVAIQFPGDELHAATQTSIEIPAPPLLPPGEGLVLTSLLVFLVVVEGVILWRALRRRRVVEDVLKAVEETHHRLQAGDEIRAVVLASYHKLRKGVEAAGWSEQDHHTHREFLVEVFKEASIPVSHLEPFVELVDRAQYDPQPIRPEERGRAVELASQLVGDLRNALRQGATS